MTAIEKHLAMKKFYEVNISARDKQYWKARLCKAAEVGLQKDANQSAFLYYG